MTSGKLESTFTAARALLADLACACSSQTVPFRASSRIVKGPAQPSRGDGALRPGPERHWGVIEKGEGASRIVANGNDTFQGPIKFNAWLPGGIRQGGERHTHSGWQA
jgi:hypothetical protein